MEGYKVEIRKVSKQITAKERVMLKDTTNAIALDELTQQGKVILDPDFYAILNVTNPKSEDKEYVKYIIVDKAGTKYVTGSESFFTAFIDIMDEMTDTGEEFSIEVYRMPSKNYKGKEFITCSIV